jgi:hypothetical protein
MSNPIIAAIDPGHEDIAPAVLGAMLARLTGAPLVIAPTRSTCPSTTCTRRTRVRSAATPSRR